MVYEYKTDTGFCMLQADCHSRPVSHCSAVQNPMPSQATVGAVDRTGRVFFLAPEPETFGPERNMYTAVQYNLGQTPAGIVQGNLRQACRGDTGGSETRPAGSLHQEGTLMSSCALPAPTEVNPMAVGGPGLGSAIDTPQTTGRPDGDTSQSALAASKPALAPTVLPPQPMLLPGVQCTRPRKTELAVNSACQQVLPEPFACTCI